MANAEHINPVEITLHRTAEASGIVYTMVVPIAKRAAETGKVLLVAQAEQFRRRRQK